jgi:hypothetical protein
MAERLGPYIWEGIDCGALMDRAVEDARKAMAKSRGDAVRWLSQMKQAHADWYRDSRPSKRELRKLGTPFSAAIRELENWLEANPPPPKPPRPKKGVVYFVGLDGDNSAVKIGFASKIENRLSSLQTSSHHTLKVLATIKGTAEFEKELHRKFAAYHIRGEWFRRTEAIEEFIASSR